MTSGADERERCRLLCVHCAVYTVHGGGGEGKEIEYYVLTVHSCWWSHHHCHNIHIHMLYMCRATQAPFADFCWPPNLHFQLFCNNFANILARRWPSKYDFNKSCKSIDLLCVQCAYDSGSIVILVWHLSAAYMFQSSPNQLIRIHWRQMRKKRFYWEYCPSNSIRLLFLRSNAWIGDFRWRFAVHVLFIFAI